MDLNLNSDLTGKPASLGQALQHRVYRWGLGPFDDAQIDLPTQLVTWSASFPVPLNGPASISGAAARAPATGESVHPSFCYLLVHSCCDCGWCWCMSNLDNCGSHGTGLQTKEPKVLGKKCFLWKGISWVKVALQIESQKVKNAQLPVGCRSKRQKRNWCLKYYNRFDWSACLSCPCEPVCHKKIVQMLFGFSSQKYLSRMKTHGVVTE